MPKLGDDHEKTKESSECLRHLTQQAVVMQKKMNEMYQVCAAKTANNKDKDSAGHGREVTHNGPGTASVAHSTSLAGQLGLPPIQIQPPTMASVLDMLNIINGILFVQIR